MYACNASQNQFLNQTRVTSACTHGGHYFELLSHPPGTAVVRLPADPNTIHDIVPEHVEVTADTVCLSYV